MSAPIFGSAVRGRSDFRRFTVLRGPSCLQGVGISTLQPSAGLISAVCCRGDHCFPLQMPCFGAVIDSRREFRRFPPRNAPSSPFCTERGSARTNSGRPKPPGAGTPVRGVLDRTGHRPFSTGRSAPAVQHRPFSTGRSAPAVLPAPTRGSHHAGCLAPWVPLTCPASTYARSVRNAPAATLAPPASGVAIGGCRVLAGSSSWADKSLVRDGSFYPSRSLKATQRLQHYASRLPLTEVATTYRFPPTPDVAKRWVASTPAGFTMDVRAWSLLSGAPTWPESLFADLQGHVKPSRREGVKLYRHHLPAAVVDECWDRFNHAVRPLAEAGRLGAILVRFPAWFSPRPAAWEELAYLPARLPGLRVAVELSNERWFEGDACEQTLGLLEELGLGFLCKDGPGPATPVVAATSEVGFVRFTGSPAGRRTPASQAAEVATIDGGAAGDAFGKSLGWGAQAGGTATDRGGDGVPASGRSLGWGPGGRNSDGPGRGWGPRFREEPGLGGPGGRSSMVAPV